MTPRSCGSTPGILRASDLRKRYGRGHGALTALDGVSLELNAGTFTALMGPSGSGKSTFLQCASGLDRPDSGSVMLSERELTTLSESAMTKLRRRHVGFVFQSYNLMSALTSEQNMRLPARLGGQRLDETWVSTVVDGTGLRPLLKRRPHELSGGQQQRVALARALVGQPDVIFADEPTGALDSRTGKEILGLLRRCVCDFGQTVLMVTHDPAAAGYADSVVFMHDGRLNGGFRNPSVDAINDAMSSWSPA